MGIAGTHKEPRRPFRLNGSVFGPTVFVRFIGLDDRRFGPALCDLHGNELASASVTPTFLRCHKNHLLPWLLPLHATSHGFGEAAPQNSERKSPLGRGFVRIAFPCHDLRYPALVKTEQRGGLVLIKPPLPDKKSDMRRHGRGDSWG